MFPTVHGVVSQGASFSPPEPEPGERYHTDFSGLPEGSMIPGWGGGAGAPASRLYATGVIPGAIGGQMARTDISSARPTWLDIGPAVDQEALLRFTPGAHPGGGTTYVYRTGLTLRVQESETTYYGAVLGTNGMVRVSRHTAGAFEALGNIGIPFTWDELYWIRARVVGARLQVRAWLDGDPEPDAWGVDILDPAPLAGGYVGVYGSAGVHYGRYDYFSVSLGGGAAPEPPP